MRVKLPVRTSGMTIPEVTTDLGYVVSLRRAELPVRDLQFTTEGETHASILDRAIEVLLPTAWAHPGHEAGGDVIGELSGSHVLAFSEAGPAQLGESTLLTGHYDGANFTFDEGDALLEGTATRDGTTWSFTARITMGTDVRMVGAPFDADIREPAAGALEWRFVAKDPSSEITLFDLIDFAALAAGTSEVEIAPGSSEANVLRRALQSHAFYSVEVVP